MSLTSTHVQKLLTVAALIVLTLGSGCASGQPGSKQTGDKHTAAGQHAAIGMGQSVASSSQPSPTNPQPSPPTEGLSEPTGRWFTNGGLATGTPGGPAMPGEEVMISIHVIEPAKAEGLTSRSIRYKLTADSADGKPLRTIDERVERIADANHVPLYRFKLPTDEGVRYTISAEMLLGDTVEDTLFSRFEVPLQQVAAELRTDQAAYSEDGSITLTVTNNGPTSISFGLDYTLERQGQDGAWTNVPPGRDTAIPSIGYMLSNGARWQQTIQVQGLKPGLYRLAKSVSGSGTPINLTIYAEFRVE